MSGARRLGPPLTNRVVAVWPSVVVPAGGSSELARPLDPAAGSARRTGERDALSVLSVEPASRPRRSPSLGWDDADNDSERNDWASDGRTPGRLRPTARGGVSHPSELGARANLAGDGRALSYRSRFMLGPLRSSPQFGRRQLVGLALAALGLSAAGAGCSKPQPPSVTPHVVRVTGVGARGLDLDVELQVHNPNSFPLSAEAVEGTLYSTHDQKLGEGRSSPSKAIPGNGSSIVASTVHVAWENLPALAPLLAVERIPYEFRGDVTLGGESIHVRLPFTLSGELTRTQLLEAGWRGL
jgi:LEA14-like dessication related protein